MPPGIPPLILFRTLARNPRVFQRFMAGGLLDKGAISFREREIIIDRTCARCGSEYEWGVHVAFFKDKAGLSDEQVRSTVLGEADDICWPDRERLLIRLVDALHDTTRIDDALWDALSSEFSDEQIIELIVLTGLYHMVSFVTNGLKLPLESYGVRFPV
ncbi:MAG: carboxymuconolactone decarboxylase family protein [Pseudomonadota bacterium]